jgi:hypothetical protein
MGGQACVLYGAAEFSRDLDLALLPDPDNLDRLHGSSSGFGNCGHLSSWSRRLGPIVT